MTKKENAVGGNLCLIRLGEGGVFGFVVVLGVVYLFTYLLFIFIYLFIILSLEYCHIHFLFVDIFVERSDKVDICIGQLWNSQHKATY